MKKYILLFIALQLLPSYLTAQSGWIWQQTYPTGETIWSVSCTDKNNCTIVGFGGIQRTTDGGKTWVTQDAGISFVPESVCFTDSLNGTTVGTNNIILHTTDGGNSWINQPNPKTGSKSIFYGVSFTDKNNGTVVGNGGTILRTTNAGKDWLNQTSGTGALLRGVSFVDSLNGIAVGDWSILKTSDAGRTWEVQYFGSYYGLSSVSFVDTNVAFISGLPDSFFLLRTTNGGKTWESLQVPSFGLTDYFQSVSFIDKNHGTIVSKYSIIHTTDGGNTWKKQTAKFGEWLNAVSFCDPNNGFIVGWGGTLLHTTNGGETWDNLLNGVPWDIMLNSVCFTDKNNGIAVGEYGTIIRSTDGGKNWHWQNPSNCYLLWGEYYWDANGVSFGDPNNGTVVGQKIFHTTDGGINWTEQKVSINGSFNLKDVSFINSKIGVAVGTDGLILNTTDGGNNWIEQNSGTIENLTAVELFNENGGCAVGEKGTILITTDGGFSWDRKTPFDSTITLNDVAFINANSLLIVGDNGTIRRSTDGGHLWFKEDSHTTDPLYSVGFSDENYGFVVGGYNDGLIFKTTDGGIHWGKQINPLKDWSTTLRSISVINSNDAVVVGYATILRTNDGGGITNIETNKLITTPVEYSLSQNYPNPFNPATTIKYDLSEVGNVTLKIYDVLGREVTTLINEEQSAGSYEIKFNGSKYPSGIYFYRIQAGSYSSVKKMILLK